MREKKINIIISVILGLVCVRMSAWDVLYAEDTDHANRKEKKTEKKTQHEEELMNN